MATNTEIIEGKLLKAITGGHDNHPQLYPITWLGTLLKSCNKPNVFRELVADAKGDSDATSMMLNEIQKMVDGCNLAMQWPKSGFIKIIGCDKATGFEKIIKESDLQEEGKKIYSEHPGTDGYYNFTKFLWVEYPDGRPECRLDSLVSYD